MVTPAVRVVTMDHFRDRLYPPHYARAAALFWPKVRVSLLPFVCCVCVSSFVFSNLSHSFWNLEFDKIGTAPRLVEPHYRCKLQCAGEHLGALYGVLARRRGDVVEEDLWEGTLIFTIEALVSVKRAKIFCGSPAHLCC